MLKYFVKIVILIFQYTYLFLYHFLYVVIYSHICLYMKKVNVNIDDLFYAMKWLGDMSFDNVDFALDSKITTDAFNSRRVDITKFGQVLFACHQLFNTKFTNLKVVFTQRQDNEATHHLVEVAALLANPTIYTYISRCIEQIVDNEIL